MLRLFLSHLLGVWLLLSLRAREIPAQEEVLKACGREFVRLQIRICGSLSWGKSSQQHREPRQAPAALPGERSGPRRSPLPIGCGRAAGHSEAHRRWADPDRAGFPRLALTPRLLMPKSLEFSLAMCFSSEVAPGISPEEVKASGTAEAFPERHLVPFTSWQSG